MAAFAAICYVFAPWDPRYTYAAMLVLACMPDRERARQIEENRAKYDRDVKGTWWKMGAKQDRNMDDMARSPAV